MSGSSLVGGENPGWPVLRTASRLAALGLPRSQTRDLEHPSLWRDLELDAALGEDAFLVGVFDFAHFGDGVGEFDEDGVGIAAGKDNVGHLGFAAEDVGDGFGVEHL